MHYFLFVRTEGGVVEMAALDALEREHAIEEAERLPFAGRTGSLFRGDEYICEVTTADTLSGQPSLAVVKGRGRPVPQSDAPLRPG